MKTETRGRKPIKESEKRVYIRVWAKAKHIEKLKKDIAAIQQKYINLN